MNFIRSFSPAVVLPLVVFLASCAETDNGPVYPKATHLYFADYSGRQVGVIDVNNIGTYTTIADAGDGLDTLSGMAIDFDGGFIYTAEETNNRILRLNLDGSGSPTVLYGDAAVDSVDMPTAVAINPLTSALYWANSGTGQLKKGALDGTGAATSMYSYKKYITYCYGLVTDVQNQILYFSDLGDEAAIWYARMDGTGTRAALFGPSDLSLQNPSALFYDAQATTLFWADEGLQKIIQGSIATRGTASLYDREDGITRPDGIAVDRGNGMIYWSETYTDTESGTKTHQIKRAALNGTGTPEVVAEGVESYSLVLRFEKP